MSGVWRGVDLVRDEERGAVTAFVAILAGSLVLMTGIVVDGGRLLRRYVEAHEVAGNAARAGAQEVVEGAPGQGSGLYGGETPPRVDASQAALEVDDFLAEAGYGSAGRTVTVDGSQVTVEITLTQSLMMLSPGSQTVTANASAIAQRGVEVPG